MHVHILYGNTAGAFEAVPDEEALIARGAMAASVACLDTPTVSDPLNPSVPSCLDTPTVSP